MSALLKELIESARKQSAAIEAEPEPVQPTTSEKAKRLTALESARQKREWADFAERGLGEPA